jgi:hypothetical protein
MLDIDLAEYDPIVDHNRVMEATRPVRKDGPQLVFKDGPGKVIRQIDDQPPLTDDLVDALAQVLVELRKDCRVMIDEVVTPLRERVAVLEGQLAMLVNMLGGNNGGKSLEASEVIRKVRVG